MINGSIVDFPKSKRPTLEEVAAQDRQGREERISRLREVLGKNPKMGGEDQIVVAQALYYLLDRIEQQQRIPKAKILREAGIGGEGDSTKHLSQYALRGDLPPEEVQRRSARLRKGTEPYKNIARAAARQANLDEGDVLLQVFEQANFWRVNVPEAPREFVELASRLRFVADGIAAKYDLTTFFRDVERACVSPAPTPESLDRGPENRHLFGEQITIEYSSMIIEGFEIESMGSWLGWPIELNQLTWLCLAEEECGDLPAYPSLILGAWVLDSASPISIRNRNEAKTPVSLQGDPFVVRPAVVLRFCIAPIGKERSATPVLRVDIWGHVGGSYTIEANSSPIPEWIPLRRGTVIVENYEIKIDPVPKLTSPFSARDIERHSSGNSPSPNILFLPVNGLVCEGWLSFPVSQNVYYVHDKHWPLRHRALGYSLFETFLQAPFSSFGGDTLAGLVDAALCDPTGGLDLLLERQVKCLKDAFEASRAAACDSRDKNWEVVKKRWERRENP